MFPPLFGVLEQAKQILFQLQVGGAAWLCQLMSCQTKGLFTEYSTFLWLTEEG